MRIRLIPESRNSQLSVIVAMAVVPEVQAPVRNAVYVIAVRNPLVAAVVVCTRAGNLSAVGGVHVIDLQDVLVVLTIVLEMKMAVVKVVRVAVVRNAGMPTLVTMLM